MKALSDEALRRVAEFQGIFTDKKAYFEDEESVIAELLNYAIDQAENGPLNNQYGSIKANLEKRIRNGTYDSELAPKLWLYLVDAAAKDYDKWHGSGSGRMPDYFPKNIRMEVARQFADNWYENEGSMLEEDEGFIVEEGREASKIAQEEGYQGYKNYETWAVALWINNDQGSYEYWQERATEVETSNLTYEDGTPREIAPVLAEELKVYHEELKPDLEGVYSDLLNNALAKVDWREVAEDILG